MGCTLNCTPNDFEQLIRSIRGRDNIGDYLRKNQFEEVRATLHQAASYKLISILSNPKHHAHKALTNIIANSFNSKMTDKEKSALPKALSIIIKDHPHAMGLFMKPPKHRGPGASHMQHHYELLSTAALKIGSFKAQSGRILTFSPMDTLEYLGFGIKLAQNYGQTKQHGTIEADTLVFKLGKTLGIDAKYSGVGKFNITKGFQRQLDGIRTGLRDGKVHEFYFVTNGVFGDDFKEMVDKENLEIAKDFAKKHNLLYHDEKHGFNTEHLTNEERKFLPPNKIDLTFFNENKNNGEPIIRNEVKKFIDRYHIKQIDLCEFVKFPGT